jgi:hypothetical protein
MGRKLAGKEMTELVESSYTLNKDGDDELDNVKNTNFVYKQFSIFKAAETIYRMGNLNNTVSLTSDYSKEEGTRLTSSNFETTVTLKNPLQKDLVIYYNIQNSELDNRDTWLPQGSTRSTVIKKGETSATFKLPVNADSNFEKDESFEVKLTHTSNKDILLGDSLQKITVLNDDVRPNVWKNDNWLRQSGSINLYLDQTSQPVQSYEVDLLDGSVFKPDNKYAKVGSWSDLEVKDLGSKIDFQPYNRLLSLQANVKAGGDGRTWEAVGLKLTNTVTGVSTINTVYYLQTPSIFTSPIDLLNPGQPVTTSPVYPV